MRWQMGRRSDNVEDTRGSGVSRTAVGGGGAMLVIGVVVALLGGDPTAFFQEGLSRTMQMRTQTSSVPKEEQDKMVDFVSVVLAGTEDTWHKRFAAMGRDYVEPKLVVFSGVVNSACGQAESAMGPFYCPLDQVVYLDVDFFHELQTRHDAPGDFAEAYVVAHEIGHHVQNLLGLLDHADGPRAGASGSSVKTELMADCLSGIWAHDTQDQGLLENGDVDEALNAATQIGDDTLQKQQQGYVMPDSFTHGSGRQRYQWFKTGFTTGSLDACNTFGK